MSEELIFTALGPSGAGKTTLLSCMHKKFEEILPGSFYPDTNTFAILSRAYKKLEQAANNSDLEFGVPLEGTSNLREYEFTIKGKRKNVPVKFYDFPGIWMNPYDVKLKENYKRVIKIVQSSQVIITAINTPYIMEYSGRYKDYTGVDEIEHVITMSLLNNDKDKLILFVPIKCEKYTRTPTERDNMLKKIAEVFDKSIRLHSNPAYKDRLAIAFIPIHTVGNARFSRFEMSGNEIIREIYVKPRGSKFSPKDADQPLRYAMSFLLNEFKKNSNTWWGNFLDFVFARDNMEGISDFIRQGIKSDGEGFYILYGRDLIGI